MYKVMLVEDSQDMQTLVRHCLSPVAEVATCDGVESALLEAGKTPYDLFLLDVELAEGDGFALASLLRRTPGGSKVPFMFLTSRSSITDKTVAFGLGAEDYIVKPVHPMELRLRVQNRLQKGTIREDAEQIIKGKVRLVTSSHQGFIEDRDLKLTPTEYKILRCLVVRSPNTVSRQELIKEVWGENAKVGRTVDTHVNSLRGKLGDAASMVQTLYRLGYRVPSME